MRRYRSISQHAAFRRRALAAAATFGVLSAVTGPQALAQSDWPAKPVRIVVPFVVAPRGTPEAIVTRVSAEVDRILKKPEVIERLRGLGAEPVGGTPADLARHIASETSKWREVVKTSGAKID